MKLINWFSPLILAFTLFACGNGGTNFVTEEIDGEFSIDVPDYMAHLDMQNPDANLQFGNELEQHFVMVISESHEELAEYGLELDIQSYADLSMDFLEMSITDPEIEQIGDGIVMLNGMEAIGYKIRGVFPENNSSIFYYAMFYRSDKSFYYITTWTLGEKEEKFAENMEIITHSLKQL